ncbi:MAG: hypothetical protein WA814_01570, partial [Candidatus Baltobacteraceae bacterium]
ASGMAPHARYTAQASLQGAIEPAVALIVRAERPAWAITLLVAVVVAGLLARTGAAALREGSSEGWAWFGLAAWVLIPNPYPWYGLWLVALAALAPGTRAGKVCLWLSFTSLLRYVPDAIAVPSPPLAIALGLAAASPLLALLPQGRRGSRQPAIIGGSYDG